MSTSELILSPLSSRLCGIVYCSHIFKLLLNHRTFTELSLRAIFMLLVNSH